MIELLFISCDFIINSIIYTKSNINYYTPHKITSLHSSNRR